MLAQQICIQQGEDLFRSVADCTYDWESWLDLSGKVVWINPAVERLTGHAVQQCLTWPLYPLEMIASDDMEMFKALLAGAKRGSSGNDVEFRVVRRDATLKWFAVSWQPLRNAGGHPIGIRMSMRDISDRKAVEEELKRHTQQLEELASARAQKILELEQRRLQMQKLAALGQMAASVAHEISNPLAGIKNALRLIRSRESLQPGNQQLLELVDKEISRIATLLNQMHQLCRPLISPPGAICIVRLLNEVIALVNAQCESKHISLRPVAWPDTLVGQVRESEVKQIMHNLLLNAYEASPLHGVVEIVVGVIDDCLQIEVIDQGPGIPEDVLPHIFEPFVSTKQDSRRAGLGLGLSISMSLAEAMNGSIVVHSVPRQGTRFIVRLPFIAANHVQPDRQPDGQPLQPEER